MKLNKVLLPFLTVMSLTGCDGLFGEGGGKEDTTIYHNTLAIKGVPEDVVAAKDYKVSAVLWVENDDGDQVAQEKVYGQVDALCQSHVDITAPFIPGYKFTGWEDDKGVNQGGFGDADISDGYTYWWNSYDRDATFYATYQLWTYTVDYGFFEKDGQSVPAAGPQKGYQYNIDKGEVALPDGVTTNLHEEFKEWYYVDRSKQEYTEVVIDKLPTDYFDDTLIIFVNYDHTKGSVILADAIFTDGSKNVRIDTLSDHEWDVEYGYESTYLIITPNAGIRGAEVTFDGEFDGNSYLQDGQTTFTYSFRFDQGKDIVIDLEFFE